MIPQLIAILVLSVGTLLIMFAFALRRRLQSIPKSSPEPLRLIDPLELITRFQFFSGKNLETFRELLEAKRYEDIQKLIAQRFQAQGKSHPNRQAEEVCQKLFMTPTSLPSPDSLQGSA